MKPNEGQIQPEVLDGKVDRTLRVEFGPNEEGEQIVRIFRGPELFWEGVNYLQYHALKQQLAEVQDDLRAAR